MPAKERRKWQVLKSEPSVQEVQDARAEINAWLGGVSADDAALRSHAAAASDEAADAASAAGGDSASVVSTASSLPPVRQASEMTAGDMKIKGRAATEDRSGWVESKDSEPPTAAQGGAGAGGGAGASAGSSSSSTRRPDPRKKSFKVWLWWSEVGVMARRMVTLCSISPRPAFCAGVL